MPEPTGPNQTASAPPVGPDRAAEELLERLRLATVGEYDIYGELGRGGMAIVYLAHEISLDRKVAIKVMLPAMFHGAGMVERFKREARTAANLSHPNIIPIYAVREAEGLLYCAIKLVEGTPLDSIMGELGELPVPMVQAILGQVGGALGYAHRHGVIHRDIKPGNILIDDEGWAVVTDFGIAKVQETENLTMTGVAVGTPTYMSPEQCTGDVVTGASDQYALGVVAYEMLAGRPPFKGSSMMAIMYSHFHDEPTPLRELRPDCPEVIASAIMRMLRKAPEDRWPSMEDAVAAIGAIQLAHDDPTRSQLISLARTGVSHRVVSQVQTPRSPIPLARRSGGATPVPGPGPRNLRPIVLLGGALALVAAGFGIARLASTPGSTPPAVESAAAGGVVEAPSVPIDSTGAVQSARTSAPRVTTSDVQRRTASSPEIAAREPAVSAGAPAVIPLPPVGPGSVVTTPLLTRTPDRTAVSVDSPAQRRSGAPGNVDSAGPPVIPAPLSLPPAARVESAPGSSGAVAVTQTPDDRTAVSTVIQSYARALAASDLALARRLYPGMPDDQRQGLEALWGEGGTMTPRWSVTDIVVNGDVATARVRGTNAVSTRRGQSSVPVALRARLERRGAEWRLVALVN